MLLVSSLVLMTYLSLSCWLCSCTGPLEMVSHTHRLDLMPPVTDLDSGLCWTPLGWTQCPVSLSLCLTSSILASLPWYRWHPY